MTTNMPIYRLVRCPKCQLVLPELADLPLYKCGGCGTVLQAKRRKDVGKSTNLPERSAAQMNSLDQDPEDKDSSSSSCKASCLSSGECPVDQNGQRGSSISVDYDDGQLGSVNLSSEDQNDDFLEQNNQKDCGLSGVCDNEKLGVLNLSNEDKNNNFLEQNDQKDCSLYGDSDSEQHGCVNQNNCSLGQNYQGGFDISGAYDNEQLRGLDFSNEEQNDGSLEQIDHNSIGFSVVCDNQHLRAVDLSNEDHSNEMHHNDSYERNVVQNGVPKEVCSPMDLSSDQNDELSAFAESNAEVDVNDSNSAKAQAKSDVESNDECYSTIKRSITERTAALNGMGQVVTTHGTARESISSDMLVSLPNKRREHSQEGIAYAFDPARSTDTLETTDFINPSSELSGKLIDLSKSPTTRSYRAYYDDSTSSFDGMDDQSPSHHRHSFDCYRHPLKSTCKAPNHNAPEERPRRNRLLPKGDAEVQYEARKFSSIVPDKMHKWNQDELQNPIGLGYPGGNWRPERDEHPSWLVSNQWGSPVGYELDDSSSNQLHDEFHRDPSINLCYKHDYTEQEKRKLLRMVNELQGQLYRSYNLNEETQGRDPAGIARKNHIPMSYDKKSMEEQSFCYSNYPVFSGRFRRESNWSQQSKSVHKPFSVEATYGRQCVMDSCLLCCRPPDWQNSSQLPSFSLFHDDKGSCKIHSIQNLNASYGSRSSSSQCHLDSEFPLLGRETKSGDLRHEGHGVKRYPREKQYSGKKNLRPIAGAAPFITCHRCLEQLQLPSDFLIFGRKCLRLRCGACSEVIKFSLKNGTQLVPYLPDFKVPPSSEIDEYGDACDVRNLASAFHPSESIKVGPESYSDDYSFSKSCSSDVDPASFTPVHPIPGNDSDRKFPSGSLKSKQERKGSFSRSKNKNPVQGYVAAEPSASTWNARRSSLEIEEVPPRSASPLHRLMGYSSPSEVIKG